MSRERTLTVQRTVYMTPEMWNYLTQLAHKRGCDCNENVLIREAVRYFIDNQADVLSSRRYFQKSFQERIDQLEERVTTTQKRDSQTIVFYLHVLIQLAAFSMAHLVSAVTRKEITSQQLLQRALIDARREEALFNAQVQSVREMSVTEKQP